MANQPPTARPWFRFATVGRQAPAPDPAPESAPPRPQFQPPAAPQPRPPFIRPAFPQAFRQTITQPQPLPSPPPPQPPTTVPQPLLRIATAPPPPLRRTPSPPPPPSPTARTSPSPPPPVPIISRSPPPPSSPHAISSPPSAIMSSKPAVTSSPPTMRPVSIREFPLPPFAQISPPQSPVKTTHSPPSPFHLPPQLKSFKGETEGRASTDAEPKRVLVQETFKKPVVFSGSYNNSSKHDRYKEGDGHKKLSSDSEDGGSVRIITIIGENKGALMELGFLPKNGGGGHSGNEDRSKIKDHKDNATSSHMPTSAYVNSNVQSVNSSILYNCSFSQHDPGVHWSLSRKPVNGHGKGNGHGIYHKDHENETQL